jgi:opacity protein-like surface antigen
MRFKYVLAGLILSAAAAAFSQIAPSATQGGIPFTVGSGYSEFYSDWSGNLSGGTLWIDYHVDRVPRVLKGIGIEAEGRDLNYRRTGDQPTLRQDTAEGGPIYHWQHFQRTGIYGKFLLGYGNMDFSNSNPKYRHDSRTVLAPGGGAEYRIWRNVWVRGDYEYQFWTHFYHGHAMNPTGGTVGVVYDLGHIHSR